METDSFLMKCFRIALVVSLYWFTSISMVFLNKQLLKSKELQLDAPFFVTFIQCFLSVLFCMVISLFCKLRGRHEFLSIRFDPKVSREVLPLSFCFVAMITFNNLSLRDLGVPFYNVGRSLTTLFNVILSYFVLKKTTPPLALVCCGVIMIGYGFGVQAEGELVDLSYVGVIYGALASFFVCLNAIYTARVLPSIGNDLWKLGYYNNINSCVLLLPVVVFSGDLPKLTVYSQLYSAYLWFVFIVVGIFGFMTGFMSSWQIQVTTPLTHNISGTAKACVQTIIAVVYFNAPKTTTWWFSNMLVLFGSLFYTIVRRNAMKANYLEKIEHMNEFKKKTEMRV